MSPAESTNGPKEPESSSRRVSLLVPVRDDREGVEKLLTSVPEDDYPLVEVIVNDDSRSSEDLAPSISRFAAEGLAVRLLRSNVSRAQGRRDAARQAAADILFHVDADMELAPGLVGEVIALVDGGADAVTIPEVSFGTSFWARCKVLEKRCWEGDQDVEAARAVTTSAYWAVDGHDPLLVWGEDKDLDLRLREIPATMARTKTSLRHDEREPTFWTSVQKKARYATTAGRFNAKHPEFFRRQGSPSRIVVLMYRSVRYSDDPWLVPGLMALKLGEYLAVGAMLVGRRLGWAKTSGTAT